MLFGRTIIAPECWTYQLLFSKEQKVDFEIMLFGKTIIARMWQTNLNQVFFFAEMSLDFLVEVVETFLHFSARVDRDNLPQLLLAEVQLKNKQRVRLF
jgi:hypothetical protein